MNSGRGRSLFSRMFGSAAVVLSLLLACAASSSGNFPVMQWWNSAALLSGFPEGTGRAGVDFRALEGAKWKRAFELTFQDGAKLRVEVVSDCKSLLLPKNAAIWDTSGPEPISRVFARRVTCGAIRRMHRVRMPRVSYLPLDLQEVLPLLAGLEVGIGPEQDRGYFKPLGETGRLECFSETRCLHSTASERTAIELLAMGDFDGDGLADLMGEAVSGPVAGTYSAARGFLVTRLSGRGSLKLMEWW